jgi:FdhD protein
MEAGRQERRADTIATEEPLEIRLRSSGVVERTASLPVFTRRGQSAGERTIAITMRTPGADLELAAGFLHGEGVVRSRHDIKSIDHSTDDDLDDDKRHNIVTIELRAEVLPDFKALERHFYTTSACGVCGKTSLDALRVQGCAAVPAGLEVNPDVLLGLPDTLRAGQSLFAATGGLHAAGLFDTEGHLLILREDVGRHNAVDKLVGAALLEGLLPLDRHIVLVSGRSSFEILQKCLMARVPILCAVSAPSSLAVALACEFGMTLVGFLRGERFNVYAGPERIQAGVSTR